MVVCVVANAKSKLIPDMGERLRSADFVIAADGGLRHCLDLGVRPGLVVGDGDSSRDLIERESLPWEAHPEAKDLTDLELALQSADGMKPEEILVFQALDEQWDYTLDALVAAAQISTSVKFLGVGQVTYIVGAARPTLEWRVEQNMRDVDGESGMNSPSHRLPIDVSVYPLIGPVDLEAEGLVWPISWAAATLPLRSQSNRLKSDRLKLHCSRGSAAVKISRP